ncbi:hypothetical protein DIPPA_11053 [Diplonema papillatum]|nr:hypothetical protein DIPPA_11053 [Diplonema papillatum]
MPVTKADYGKVERGLWEDEIRVVRQLTPMLLSHARHHAPPSSDITADLAVMVRSGVIPRAREEAADHSEGVQNPE